MSASLPPPRRPGLPYRIGFVCLGNICRSPMADVVLTGLVERAGLTGQVVVDSCGTGGWHVGEPMDRRAAATLLAADYDPSAHRARQLDASWADHDLLLTMDEDNLHDAEALLGPDPARLRLFRAFDPLGPGEVPDPYAGGPEGFDLALAMVERTAIAILDRLERLERRQGRPSH